MSPVIYLVDDEEILLSMVEGVLSRGPWQVKAFADPEKALRSFHAEATKPGLLVTDYAMPGMTGLELAAECRAMASDLKVVMISGTMSPKLAQESPSLINCFLAKPFNSKELWNAVESVIG